MRKASSTGVSVSLGPALQAALLDLLAARHDLVDQLGVLVAEERPHRVEVGLLQRLDEGAGGCVGGGLGAHAQNRSLRGMAARDEVIAFCDELLDAGSFDDYGPNGVQVPGASEVTKRRDGGQRQPGDAERRRGGRRRAGAGPPRPAVGRAAGGAVAADGGRLRALLGADATLAAYHLPLDAHPEVGNNALLRELLGLERRPDARSARRRARPVGAVGTRAGAAVDGRARALAWPRRPGRSRWSSTPAPSGSSGSGS